MAIFETGVLVGSISGNVGGANFVNTSGSSVVRKTRRPSPAGKNSAGDASVVLVKFAHKWATLSELEQSAWNQYALNRPRTNRLGVSRPLNGYQSYLSYQIQREHSSSSDKDDPPVSFTPQVMNNYSLTSSVANDIVLNYDTDAPLVSKTWHLYGRNLFRGTIPAFNNSWTFISNALTTGTSFNVSGDWDDVLGLPVLGQVIALRVLPISTVDQVQESKIDLFAITTA